VTVTVEKRRAVAKAWVAQRKLKCIQYLGGKCVRCGTVDALEFDHVDRATKSFTITSNLNRRWEILKEELDKCQLLCKPCHRQKTVEAGETGGGHNKADVCPHGTLWGYGSRWKCRCDLCKAAKAASRCSSAE
jgi:5-methylcytosine-specific restriction endonuclease McrA